MKSDCGLRLAACGLRIADCARDASFVLLNLMLAGAVSELESNTPARLRARNPQPAILTLP
jgi:hypothetical protein